MSMQRTALAFTALTALSLSAASGEADTSVIIPPKAEPAAALKSAPLSLAERWGLKASASPKCELLMHVKPELADAIQRYVAPFPDPAAKTRDILDKMKYAPVCFQAETPEEFDRLVRTYELLPPTVDPADRYTSAATVFVGNGSVQNASGRAQPVNLTYSFPADGTTWGTPSTVGFPAAPNELTFRLNSFFGAANVDRAREIIRQALANWRRNGGITYTETLDDNSPETTAAGRSNFRGDIRIGAIPLDGGSGVLAYNNFPNNGSDMNFDALDFGSYASSSNNYRFFRNVTAHEHGHGMAYIHQVPCNNTKLMEPLAGTNFDVLQVDDQRGIQRNYGDRFAGNNSAATAVNFGNLTTPSIVSVIERDLSTNGTAGFNDSDEDWYRFTLGSAQNIVITVDPTGGSFTTGSQSSGCSGTTATVNADIAGNLNIELRDSTGTTIIQSATSAAAGVNEVLTRNGAAAGTYTLRVFDVGPNLAVNQIVQMYDLTIAVAGATAPPQAVAGLNKRIGQGLVCWFRGDINSRALQPGAGISSYQWDFTNDGTFDASGAEVSTIYATPGLRTVRLRVTDTNGRFDEDLITVDVFDNTPPPPPGPFNLLSPANNSTITETAPIFDWSDATNIENYVFTLDDNADFSSPLFSIDVFDSQSFTSPGTFAENVTYYWKIVAENPFGSTASTPAVFNFKINTTPPPPCPGDLDGDGNRNTVDLVQFLSFFGQAVTPGTNGDLDGNGTVNTVDLVQLLSFFGVPCP